MTKGSTVPWGQRHLVNQEYALREICERVHRKLKREKRNKKPATKKNSRNKRKKNNFGHWN